jgi:hypothetical protein
MPLIEQYSVHSYIHRFLIQSVQVMQDDKAQLEALRQFQMRALSLIEVWLKKQPQSPLIVHCALPLLRTLRAAARPSGHRDLATRLRRVLVDSLAGAKPVLPPDLAVGLQASATAAAAEADTEKGHAADSDAAALERVCNKVMYFAAREQAPEVREAATKTYTCLLGALSRTTVRSKDSLAAEVFAKQCKACVDDVLLKRKSRWTCSTIEKLVTVCNPAAMAMLQRAAPLVTAARTEHTKVEALQICASCMKCASSQRLLKRASAHVASMSDALHEVFSSLGVAICTILHTSFERMSFLGRHV